MKVIYKNQFLSFVKNKLWLIILSAVLLACCSFCFHRFFSTPKYEVAVKLYANNNSIAAGSAFANITTSELAASQKLVDTYLVILDSYAMMEEVREISGVDRSYEQLQRSITARSVEGTEVFEVVVTDPDPLCATRVANTIAVLLPQRIASIVDGTAVWTVEYASMPTQPSTPGVLKSTMSGFLFGISLSLTLLLCYALSDDRIRSRETLETAYPQIPVLSTLPTMSFRRKIGKHNSKPCEAE